MLGNLSLFLGLLVANPAYPSDELLATSDSAVLVEQAAANPLVRTDSVAAADTGFGLDKIKAIGQRAIARVRAFVAAYDPGTRASAVDKQLLRILFYFMVAFVICIFLMLILIVVSRFYKAQVAKRRAQLKEKYENILIEILYSTESESSPHFTQPDETLHQNSEQIRAENAEELNSILDTTASSRYASNGETARTASKIKLDSYFETRELERRFNREVLIGQILELHKNLSGTTANILRNLYLELEFDKDAMRRLSISSWNQRAKAVRELSQMEIAEAEEPISQLLNDSSDILTLEVQIALLKLNPEHPFAFLDKAENELTEWHQLNLLTMISSSPRFKIPEFKTWLSSSNDSVVIFSTRMISYYNQLDAIDELIQTLTNLNERIRSEVIKCLGDLESAEADVPLIQMYPAANEEVRLEILDVLGRIATEKAVRFLQSELNNPKFNIAFHAAAALSKTGQYGIDLLNESTTGSDNKKLQRIARHVMDERIG